MHLALGSILLGLINIALFVAIWILIGFVIVLAVRWLFNKEIDADIRKWYLIVVGLAALYMLVALLLGLPSVRVIGYESRIAPVTATVGPPSTQVIR